MKEVVKKRSRTISATDPAEFDRLYNSTSDELAMWDPEVDTFNMNGVLYARFVYEEREKIAVTKEDEFMQENVRCTCSDCPFLEVGTDARRKWFPCKYSSCGESRLDSSACEVFYREAVHMMREAAGR
jgi:hypothetical protein